MKRQRGRGRKPGGAGHHANNGGHQHPNRTLESSGPDMKVRGPASHIYERYLQLARDASSSGDRVMAENYSQHAEHYFRMLRAMQPAMPSPSAERFGGSQEFEGDEDGGQGDNGENDAGGEGDQPDVEFPGAQQQQQQQQQQGYDRDDRRRRSRRSRFRPEGEGGEAREGGGERPERPEGARPERQEGAVRPDRGERPPRPPPRERDSEGPAETAEGFSSGPKPAFLRSD